MLSKRLVRRIKWLFFYQWSSLSLKVWLYESCKHCGKAFRIRWEVEDKYWQEVVNVNDTGGGSLCIDCFIELANKRNIDIPDSAFKIFIFNPTD